ncbi:unnamed protein product [Lampetra planeri]
MFVQCTPLSSPAVKVLLSNVTTLPQKHRTAARDLQWFGTIVSLIVMLPLRTRGPTLAHIMSLQRQTFMILKDSNTNLNDKENTAQPAPTHTVQQQQKPQQQQQQQNQQQQNLQQQQQDHPQQDNKKQQQQQAPADSAADRAKSATDGERDGFTIVESRKRRGPSEPSGRRKRSSGSTMTTCMRVSRVRDLVDTRQRRWGPVLAFSEVAGLRSTLAGEKLLREAVRTLQKLGLKLEMPDDSTQIFRRLDITFYESAFVHGVAVTSAQAKLSICKSRKQRLEGDSRDCGALAMLKALKKARLKLEHSYYGNAGGGGCLFKEMAARRRRPSAKHNIPRSRQQTQRPGIRTEHSSIP